MTDAHPGANARRRASVALAAALLALAAVLTLPVLDPDPGVVQAASGRPLAVIVVGPVETTTPYYLRDARRIAAQLRSYGARVREVYSPNATWTRVKEAARGANLFVYLGHGNGYPSPYGSFDGRKMNGLGLNASGGHGNWNVKYYGEYFVRHYLHLADGAVVILNHVCYAAGGSEPGRAYPTRRTATRRADNFAAGFLDAGAAAVFASDRSVSAIVRDLFGRRRTMRVVFWHSPWTSYAYDSRFRSGRTPGARGVLAPYSPGRYYQSVVGDLDWTTLDWRHTWNPPAVVTATAPSPSPSPTPEPSPSQGTEPAPTPDPSAAPTPDPSATSAPDPGASPTPTPDPTPTPAPTPTVEPSVDPAPTVSPSPTP